MNIALLHKVAHQSHARRLFRILRHAQRQCREQFAIPCESGFRFTITASESSGRRAGEARQNRHAGVVVARRNKLLCNKIHPVVQTRHGIQTSAARKSSNTLIRRDGGARSGRIGLDFQTAVLRIDFVRRAEWLPTEASCRRAVCFVLARRSATERASPFHSGRRGPAFIDSAHAIKDALGVVKTLNADCDA